MKRIIDFLKTSLDVSINEARGVLILAGIIFICLVVTLFYSNYSNEANSNVVITEYGGTPLPKEEKQDYYQSNHYNYHENHYKNFDRSFKVGKRFPFDPNSSSQTEFDEMGMPKYLSKIIINYRSKGGKFKYKEDMLKIYGMKPELYESLTSYIQLPAKTENSNRSFEEYSALNAEESKPKYQPKVVTIEKFDINTADTSKLVALKGIGTGYANRIIKYRDYLGGFYTIDQVAETYGLSPEVMIEIKKYAFVGSNVKKININQSKITKHPYLNYNQINALQKYKQQHGNYKNIDDLRNVKILDDETINKINPYIEF